MKLLTRRNKLFVVVALGVVTALVAVSLFSSSLNKPAQGTISSESTSVTPASPALMATHGKTISFSYPSTLHLAKADALSSGDVEKFALVSTQEPPWNISIQIRKLPSGQLTDDGSYNLRKTHPELYKEQQLTLGQQKVVIMSEQNAGYAKVAFLVHGGLVAEIAISNSSSLNNTMLDQAVNSLISSWQWL